ncbi:homeobox protein dve-1-like [Mytilus edulis]|uniref:homeobox protein dve-1-like n=1 Tax=Mytilus edulis TaxID=6550 RepID=UPI0039EFF229
MDFHAAMETFAEAWVAANVHTAVNTDPGQINKQSQNMEDQTTNVLKDHPKVIANHQQPPTSQPTSPTAGAKSLPIHCVVEQTSGPVSFDDDGSSHYTVELDSYAILPCTTLFSELVRAALVKLGYNSTESMNAKGAIQIKNWRPLTFEAISNNSKSTVEDILGELTQVAKLRIRLCSKAKISSVDEVKGRLLQLLLNQSQGLLMNSGCPIEKSLLTTFAKGDAYANLSPELRQAFDKWYAEQIRSVKPEESRNTHETSPEKQVETIQHTESTSVSSTMPSAITSSPHFHCKTRMRTSFDPEHEIPRLQRWFQDNQHPTREQMIHYLDELNSLDARKGRRPLDLTNIIYWFKNARAAHRRASRQFDGDGSFDLEDGQGTSLTGDQNLPYLPNKNAVYMLPYPIHGHHFPTTEDSRLTSETAKGQNISNEDSREPFDLSQSRTSSQSKSPVEIKREVTSPLIKETGSVQLKQEADDTENNNKSSPAVNGCNKSDVSSPRETNNYDGNSKMNSDSEMDDSEFEDDKSNVGSDSSHEAANLSIKNMENQGFLSNGLAHLPKTSTGLHQPLHIPHFPHPLAMHYFPMNTHFMAQQAARYNQQQQQQQTSQMSRSNSSSNTHRKRRTRVFIDPMSEIPILEKWFAEDTHPSSYMIDKYTDELNRSEYRQKFPRLEPKNIQLWFKNHRAKVKRMRLSQDYDHMDQVMLDSDDQSDIIKREIHS